jgi:sensor histidine kinase YesM
MRLVRELIRKLREFKSTEETTFYHIEIAERSRVSLRMKFIFYFLAVLVIPVSLFTALYHFGSIRIMESEIEKSIRINFDQMQENLVSLLLQNDAIGRSILYDRTVQQFMSAPEENRTDSNEIFQKLNEKMEVGQYYSQISVYDLKNRLILSNINGQDTYLDVALSERLTDKKGETLWIGPAMNEYQRWYVYALIRIQYLNDQGLQIPTTIGYARLGVEEAYLEQMYRSSLADGVDIFLQDETGTIVSHIDKKKIGTVADTGTEASGNDLVLKEPIANTPWHLVEKYSYDRIQSESSRLLVVNIYYTLAIILFMTFLIWFFSFLFARPLNRFRSLIEATGVDDSFESISEVSSYSEIHELVGAYNGMVERIENLIDEVLIAKMARRELEGQKKELELIALQGQINPHFLCNTLETIKWTIYDRDVKKAVVMIDSLNNLFKYGISRIENVITIEQEVRYAQSYTEIVQLRSSSKIDFEWDIDDELLQRKTIKLILQPIIENAIHHGLETRKKGGHVMIRCRTEGEEIVFTVQDDGVGLSPEKLEQIRNKLEDRHANHIGLNNVHARIKIFFGEAYGLTIDSAPNQGTTVRIRLPKID